MGRNYISKLNGARPAAQSHTAHQFKEKQHDGKTYSGASVKAVRRETVPLFDIRRNGLLPLFVVGTLGALAPAAEAREGRRKEFTEGARDKRAYLSPQRKADYELCSAVHSVHEDVYREAECSDFIPPSATPGGSTSDTFPLRDVPICSAIRSVIAHGEDIHGCDNYDFAKGFGAGAATVAGGVVLVAGAIGVYKAYKHCTNKPNAVSPSQAPSAAPTEIELIDLDTDRKRLADGV